jgi:cytochrome c5
VKKFAAIAAALALAAPAIGHAADGAEVWKSKCANCHGEDGSGKTKMGEKLGIQPMSSAAFQGKSDADLEKATAEGIAEKKMPAYKDKLSPDELKAVVKHMRSFKK